MQQLVWLTTTQSRWLGHFFPQALFSCVDRCPPEGILSLGTETGIPSREGRARLLGRRGRRLRPQFPKPGPPVALENLWELGGTRSGWGEVSAGPAADAAGGDAGRREQVRDGRPAAGLGGWQNSGPTWAASPGGTGRARARCRLSRSGRCQRSRYRPTSRLTRRARDLGSLRPRPGDPICGCYCPVLRPARSRCWGLGEARGLLPPGLVGTGPQRSGPEHPLPRAGRRGSASDPCGPCLRPPERSQPVGHAPGADAEHYPRVGRGAPRPPGPRREGPGALGRASVPTACGRAGFPSLREAPRTRLSPYVSGRVVGHQHSPTRPRAPGSLGRPGPGASGEWDVAVTRLL